MRMNKNGTLYTLVYDKVISANVDPIEKKPIFHLAPGSKSFSIATVGCNFRCSFCQNYSISQMPRESARIVGESITPREIAQAAVQNRCKTISYTYTEPTIFYELARDTMVEGKNRGLLNVFVTNGYMTRDMLDDSKGLLDAANVDLKAFTDKFYARYCKARLKGVLDTLKHMKELGVWVEVTTLIIPTLNDDPQELRDLARFIRTELGPETPWHVSRFHPDYKELHLPPTDGGFVQEARQIGLDQGLYYVYTGNLPWDAGEKTYCPKCSALVIDRRGYTISENRIKEGFCHECGQKIDGLDL